MSVEQVKKFYEQIQEEEDLQSEFEGPETEEALVEKAVALGSEHGFEFSAEDVKTVMEQARAEAEELDEAELEDVAGGLPSNAGVAEYGCVLQPPLTN